MQMESPSPLRDPHSTRAQEPKDYNILNPLKPDGSDFTCKGYQWNTPLTPVATYSTGESYTLRLKGGATHGGGSCQVSLSCDNGVTFRVLKSIIGGCPITKQYNFTVPDYAQSGRCLLGWTWYVCRLSDSPSSMFPPFQRVDGFAERPPGSIKSETGRCT